MATKAQRKQMQPEDDSLIVGVRELNHNLSRLLAQVKMGEVVEITEHGKLIAKLVPASTPSQSILEEWFASGQITPAKNPEKLLEIKPIKYKGKISLSQEIINERRSARF